VKPFQWVVATAAVAAATGAFGQSVGATSGSGGGFYGGISLRDRDGVESPQAIFGKVPASWATLGGPVVDEGQRTLLFGGYRLRKDVAVEASFNARDALNLGLGAPGIGLALAEPAARAWNLDLYTTWEMNPALSFYGRLGYGQQDPRSAALASATTVDARRPVGRDAVNYGVGLRFDFTRSLGLRMEYSRYRQGLSSPTDLLTSGLPDSDQLSIGVQFRF
jgi:hypothetical protein